jgi:glycosyltransferase involved in cell wall biosynthesis
LKFSIILPTYNRAEMIQNAINSVLKQTYKDWELIIIDDGSTDNTKNIVDKHKKEDQRIKYFFQKNQERSIARNNGIKQSKNEWICFLDSDDIYHKTHLHEFNKLINLNGEKKDLYFCGLSHDKYSYDEEQYDLSHKNNVEFVLLNNFGTPRACTHRSILLKHQFNEKIRVGEDRELWVRILRSKNFYFHNKKTFIEIDHKERSVNNIENLLENVITTKLINREKKIARHIKKRILSNSYFSLTKGYLRENLKFKALISTLKSILTDFSNKQTSHRIYICFNLMMLKAPKEYQNK